nr:hypothetical protein [Eubacterium sp.]
KVKTAGTITQLGTASDGFVADIPSIGYSEKTSFWFVQAMLNNLHIYNGATYRYNCTITSDQDKIVYVMVVDSDDLVLGGEYVELKAGEPYSFSKSVKIPNDLDSELSLKFGFGKTSRDALSNYSPINVRVENISFVTSTFIPNPTTTVTTTTKEQTTKNQKKNTVVKVGKAKIKKVYKKKKTAKKVKLVLNSIPNVDKYQVAVYKKKKNANKNSKALITKLFNKTKIIIKTKKIKNKKKLYIRARGVRTENKVSRYGEWSDIKKVKIKK